MGNSQFTKRDRNRASPLTPGDIPFCNWSSLTAAREPALRIPEPTVKSTPVEATRIFYEKPYADFVARCAALLSQITLPALPDASAEDTAIRNAALQNCLNQTLHNRSLEPSYKKNTRPIVRYAAQFPEVFRHEFMKAVAHRLWQAKNQGKPLYPLASLETEGGDAERHIAGEKYFLAKDVAVALDGYIGECMAQLPPHQPITARAARTR